MIRYIPTVFTNTQLVFGPDRTVLTFIGYKQTDRQTNKQTDKPNLYIDMIRYIPTVFTNTQLVFYNTCQTCDVVIISGKGQFTFY